MAAREELNSKSDGMMDMMDNMMDMMDMMDMESR
jgi:hypothetical protein